MFKPFAKAFLTLGITALMLSSWPIQSAQASVSYTGGTTVAPTTGDSGYAQSSSTLGSASASAAVTLTYLIPKTVALAIYDASGSNTSSALLSGGTPVASVFNLNASAADIGAGSNLSRSNFLINGVVFSNAGSGASAMTVNITANNSSSGTTLNLRNGSNEVQVTLAGTIGGTNFAALGTSFTPTLNASTGRGTITLTGDVNESTLGLDDVPGSYTGVVTIALTAP